MCTRRTIPTVVASLLVLALAGAAHAGGFLGVQVRHAPDGKGIQVVAILDNSPAARAGIRANDVIVRLDGKRTGGLAEFVETIVAHNPGDVITLEIVRQCKRKEIEVKVAKR